MTTIQNQTFGQERALYGSQDLLAQDCAFDTPAVGEIIVTSNHQTAYA